MSWKAQAVRIAKHFGYLSLVCGLIPFAGSARADWLPDGTPLCSLPSGQLMGRAVSDGGHGAIVVWDDNRSGAGTDVYAQRVDMDGNVLWAAEGVAICTATGAQYNSRITSDGAGGAVIAWLDMRSGLNDIYAQRIDANGNVLWTANGVPVCTEVDNQTSPCLVPGGSGSVIIAWQDYRSGSNWDIYAQRLSGSDGAQLWAAGGRAICTATGSQYYPDAVSDGAGGAIITWQDSRSGNYDLYAQRVNIPGTPQWTADGVVVCNATNNQVNPVMVSDAAGGAIVGWQDYRGGSNYDIYAQRLTGSGTVSWTANGVALCTAANSQSDPRLISDGASGAIVTWQDSRGSNTDVYAQRINSSGTALWTADGVMICGVTGSQNRPSIASDGSSGAIVTWEDSRTGIDYNIYAQKVGSTGVVQWVAAGIAICSASGNQQIPQIVSDNFGGAIIAWQDERTVTSIDIYAGHVDGDGNAGWTHCGVPISVALRYQSGVEIISDGGGGAIMAWEDFRNNPDESDIYAQRVFSDGYRLWSKNGIAVSATTGDQMMPSVAPDGSNGLLVTWEDTRNGGSYDIYAQRVGSIQNMLWRPNGAVVCSTTASTYYPQVTSDGAGGAIVVWENIVPAGNSDIYAQRLNSSGSQLWAAAGVIVCNATNHQFRPRIVSDGAGGAIITWYDLRSGTADIYAQRLNSSGTPLWTGNGVLVCGASGSQNAQHMISDGAGGAIICWTDTRAGDYDIYAQRLNSSGTALWAANGAYVCTASGGQNSSALVSDGAGGAIISWEDNRGTSSDIYAQRLNSSGTPLWTIDGVIVNACADAQTAVDITTDGSGGAIMTWQDHRSGITSDIYAQRLSASGSILWETDGNVVCTSDNDETRPVVTYSASGQAIIAWNSYNVTTSDDIYALSTYYTVSVPDWQSEVAPSPAVSLEQNFPNPFNPITHITFALAAPGEVSLRIYDIAGRVLRTLVDGWRDAGAYREVWDGRADDGRVLPSGVYFYTLETREYVAAHKMVLLK